MNAIYLWISLYLDKMKYNNKNIRRQDRLLEETDAIELLRNGEYGVLSMIEKRQDIEAGYGIPINYVWNGAKAIYFHCAPEGHKLVSLGQYANVSFCVVGSTHVISHKFTTAYESIIVRGVMDVKLSPEERRTGLQLLIDKYSPEDREMGANYIEKSFRRTNVIRLDMEELSGKTKNV